MPMAPNGLIGGVICLAAIYFPSFLLLIGILPFWEELRQRPAVRCALDGANAAVVGLLLAALCSPVWTSAIFSPFDFAIALCAFALLVLAHATLGCRGSCAPRVNVCTSLARLIYERCSYSHNVIRFCD
jgi:chromate transport protein ChrA